MNVMIVILTLLSIITIGGYTTAVCIKRKGVPNSISATFYSLKHKWAFRLTMWLTPLFLMPAILEASKVNTEFLAFLALIGIIIVGCAPDYENDAQQGKLHTIGAIMCLLFSQIWVAFNLWWILIPVWMVYIAYTGISMLKNKKETLRESFMETEPMFWIEICAFLTTYTTLLLY